MSVEETWRSFLLRKYLFNGIISLSNSVFITINIQKSRAYAYALFVMRGDKNMVEKNLNARKARERRVLNPINTGTRTMKTAKDYSRSAGKVICKNYMKGE